MNEPTYRACDLCLHGQGEPGQRKCEHPDATQRKDSVPVKDARSIGGVCGPEARYLHLTSWGRV